MLSRIGHQDLMLGQIYLCLLGRGASVRQPHSYMRKGLLMNWGTSLYGDPCRECGYDWAISLEDALSIMAAIPARYAALLGDNDGSQRHPDLAWSAGAYVCHVTDNLRIWAERLAGCALGGHRHVSGYDENLLARARAYERVPIAGALWSLRHAVDNWTEAVDLALRGRIVLIHAERGAQTALDVVRNNTHDAYHHEWDIHRSVADRDCGEDRLC